MSKDGGLLGVEKILLPKSCAQEAVNFMRYAGRKGLEAVALWAGVREGATFRILRTIIPKQLSGSLENGLMYVVEESELHRISLDLFDSRQQLIAQVHSHPGTAYHSDTDDAYPIVTVLGGLSVVVPNFAREGVNPSTWAVYRLFPDVGWIDIKENGQRHLLEVVNDIPANNRVAIG